MKARLDYEGILLLKRKGEFKRQVCPFGDNFCSDECPLFYEELVEEGKSQYLGLRESVLYVTLCNGRKFKVEKDERDGAV